MLHWQFKFIGWRENVFISSPNFPFCSVLWSFKSLYSQPFDFSHQWLLSPSLTISSVAKYCCSFFWALKSLSLCHFHSKKPPSAPWLLLFSILLSYSILPRLYHCSYLIHLFSTIFLFSSETSIHTLVLTSVPFIAIYHYNLHVYYACFLPFHTSKVLLTSLCSLRRCWLLVLLLRFVPFPERSG